MAARYPLVLNGTTIQELQSADTLAGVDAFASGTTMLFLQAAAPTGWTKSTTHDNKALRIVSGSGGGSGGSNAFSTAFGASGNTDATTLSTTQMPSHNHSITTYRWDGNLYNTVGKGSIVDVNSASTNSTGGGGSHTHSLGINVQYVDAIICVKD